MMDNQLFSKLDYIAKEIRKSKVPFGGVQLILSGDFFQLPPVQLRFGKKFAFDSQSWIDANICKIELTEVVRQSGEENRRFVEILSEIRKGCCSPAISSELSLCHVDVKPMPLDGIIPTKLYCTNKDVDEENTTFLSILPGNLVEFRAVDNWKTSCSSDKKKQIEADMERKTPGILKLKVGAQVNNNNSDNITNSIFS